MSQSVVVARWVRPAIEHTQGVPFYRAFLSFCFGCVPFSYIGIKIYLVLYVFVVCFDYPVVFVCIHQCYVHICTILVIAPFLNDGLPLKFGFFL